MINESDSTPNGRFFNQHNISYYKLLVESLAKATWKTDSRGRALEDAPGWRAYTGQTVDHWMKEGWMGAVHPENKHLVLEALKNSVESR